MEKFMITKNIYLCGFMGSGKTRTGRILSEKTGMVFMDLDNFIVRETRMTIPAIFKLRGEEYFRREETRCLETASRYRTMCYSSELKTVTPRVHLKGHIIALGGGTVLRAENVAIIREHGVCFLIDAPFDVCYSRIAGDRGRPIAASSTRAELLQRYNDRLPAYKNAADYVINGGTTDKDYVIKELLKFLPVINRTK